MSGAPQRTRLRWSRSVRVVADDKERQPIVLFESICDSGELEALLAARAFTDDYERDLAARLERIDPRDRLAGPGSSDAMTPFLFYPPSGSRFTDGSFGIYYAARRRDTSIAETVFHKERFLAFTSEPSAEIAMRVLYASHDTTIVDLRGEYTSRPDLYATDPKDYGAAQRFGVEMRAAGHRGIAYDSVRLTNGQCIALFTPRAVGPVTRGEQLGYVWSQAAARIVDVREIRPVLRP